MRPATKRRSDQGDNEIGVWGVGTCGGGLARHGFVAGTVVWTVVWDILGYFSSASILPPHRSSKSCTYSPAASSAVSFRIADQVEATVRGRRCCSEARLRGS